MPRNFNPKSAHDYYYLTVTALIFHQIQYNTAFCTVTHYCLILSSSANPLPKKDLCYECLISNSIGQQRARMYYAVFDEELRREL